MSNRPKPREQLSGPDFNGLIAAVARDRDRDAFRQIFDYFAPRLLAFLEQQGGAPHSAEDVMQETMVNVWRKAAQFDPGKAAASTWIFTIARNARIDHLRKARRPAHDPNDPALAPEPAPPAHDTLSRRQESERLMHAVSGLPAEQVAVLRMAFFEEKAHGQVALELGIPLGTVKSRIRLAMKRIRNALGDLS